MDSNTAYYKRIANPICTLSTTQKGMIGNYKKVVSRQSQSRQTRLLILAEKRSRLQHHEDPSDCSEVDPPSERDAGPSEASDASEAYEASEESMRMDARSVGSSRKSVPIRRASFIPPPEPFRMFTPPPEPFRMFTPPVTIPPIKDDTSEDSDLGRKLYKDELESRMQDMGMGKQPDESIRTQELRYWRKKVSLEEEAAVKQAGMLLSLLSSFVESFTNAIGFTTIRTKGLSEAIQTALESGDFDLAIKSYCVSPQALSMLKNPVTSFMTSFGHVLLRTHIENVRRELEDGIQKFKQKKSMPEHIPAPIPPSQMYAEPTTPWDTRNIVDPTGSLRPVFKVHGEASPNMVDAFRSQVTSMAPVLSVLKQVAATATPSTHVADAYDPSELDLA
jgi:hypothetical protein